jgi:hypothetical protein
MKRFAAAVIVLSVFPTANARADDWHGGPGIAYVSKIDDVLDIYKDNLKNQGKSVDISKALPIGIGFDLYYQWDTGLRVGAGVGPYFRLSGDAKHFELPINGTVGYSFAQQSSVSPYVKAGVVHHFASGDFYESSDPGVLAAGGLDFVRHGSLRYTIELSVDESKIELDRIPGTTEKLHSYETVVSVYVKF